MVGPASAQVTVLLMKVRDIIKLLEQDGWYLGANRGSHRQYKHPTKAGRLTLPGHPNDDLPRGLNSVLKQAGLKQ
jgi:predicted RNA binding protein YcfA (HicA-like mRNA interferase family)